MKESDRMQNSQEVAVVFADGRETAKKWDRESSFVQLGAADLGGQGKRYRAGTETFSDEKLINISARPKFDESMELHDLCLWNILTSFLFSPYAHAWRSGSCFMGFLLLVVPYLLDFFFNLYFKYWRISELFQVFWLPYYIIRVFWEHGIY